MENETERVVLKVMETVLELQLLAVRQALGEEKIPPIRTRRVGARSRSLVDQVLAILRTEGQPLHVNEILLRLREEFGRITDRDTLSSSLSKKAKQGVLLRQTSPATFTLLREDIK